MFRCTSKRYTTYIKFGPRILRASLTFAKRSLSRGACSISSLKIQISGHKIHQNVIFDSVIVWESYQVIINMTMDMLLFEQLNELYEH